MKRVALLMCLAPFAFADQITIPNPLENGSVADAAAVQANFDTLAAESNENDARLDGLEDVIKFDASLENTVVGNGLGENNPDLSISEYSGGYSTAVGYDALKYNTNGWSNTAIGAWALLSNTEGYRNTALGTVTLSSNLDGIGNVAVGWNSLYENISGDLNTAVGYESLVNNISGANNTAIGVAALGYNTEGYENTSIGRRSLLHNTSGNNNAALGTDSLLANTTGEDNTAAGSRSLERNVSGHKNSAVGMYALETNVTGFSNSAIGYKADVTQGDLHNATAIGYNAKVRANNTVQIGDDEVTDIYLGQRASGSENQSGAADANLHLRGKLTTGAVTFPNADGGNGYTLKTDGSGNIGWAPDSDTLATIDCGQESGFTLIWDGSTWGCSANGSYVSRNIELGEQVAALEAQLQSQQEELLALVQSQQEQIAQLQRMVEHQFVAR